jgi:hypothetical protein
MNSYSVLAPLALAQRTAMPEPSCLALMALGIAGIRPLESRIRPPSRLVRSVTRGTRSSAAAPLGPVPWLWSWTSCEEKTPIMEPAGVAGSTFEHESSASFLTLHHGAAPHAGLSKFFILRRRHPTAPSTH